MEKRARGRRLGEGARFPTASEEKTPAECKERSSAEKLTVGDLWSAGVGQRYARGDRCERASEAAAKEKEQK